MDEACDMVALPWVLRKAIAVLNYLEARAGPLAWRQHGASVAPAWRRRPLQALPGRMPPWTLARGPS